MLSRAIATLLVALALGLGSGVSVATESRVDLNEASLEELTSLPGIGPARAKAIIEWREEAPFESADDLTEVPGIGPSLVDELRDRVEVGEPERQARSSSRRR